MQHRAWSRISSGNDIHRHSAVKSDRSPTTIASTLLVSASNTAQTRKTCFLEPTKLHSSSASITTGTFFCGWFRRVGWRIEFPPGVVAVESVDEILKPAPGNLDGSGNGPQGQAFTEQTENEGFFLLGDRADFWMLDELPLATSAEKFRCARSIGTIENHMGGSTVRTRRMDTSR